MKCKDFLKELNEYLDGNIDVQLKTELEEHLQWCHNCFVVCNTTQKTIEIYRDNEVYPLPEPIRDRLHQAIVSKCKSKREQTT
ncbi:MAG TPA: zf-HC2 domain-containing protein [Terriglobales bacterium]|nr:zf-HC2 domain-containing protein [Terriglobales bacterium]